MNNEKIELSRNLRLLVKSSFVIFAGLMIAKIMNYLYKIIIARSFGPEVYGLYSLSFIVISLAVSLSSLGLYEGLMRYISYFRGNKKFQNIKYLISLSLTVSVITSVTAALIVFLFADTIAIRFFDNLELAYFLKFFSISIPFLVISGIFVSVIRGFEKIKHLTFLESIFPNVLRLLLLVLLIFIGLKIESIAYSYVLASVLSAFMGFWIYKKISKKEVVVKKKDKIDKKNLRRKFFSYSWPIIFIGLLYNIFFWTDSIILGYFENVTTVGFYNAATALAGLLAIAPVLFMQLFLPMISHNLSQRKMSLIRDLTKQVSKWIFLINIPIFAAILFFPGVFVNFFFGDQYLLAAIPLVILSFGTLVAVFANLFTGMLSMKGKTHRILKILIVVSIINVLLDILLVKLYGMNGAAIATSTSWFILTAILFFNVRKEYGFIPLKRTMIKITVVTLLVVGFLKVMETIITPTIPMLILTGILFMALYIWLLIITKSVDKEDMDIISIIHFRLSGINPLRKKI